MDHQQHEIPADGSQRPEGRYTRRQIVQGGVALGAAVTLGSLLAACGETSTGGTSASPSVGAPTKGGDLLVGVGAGSAKDTLDAHMSINEPDIARQFELYEPLIGRDRDFQMVNLLAEEVSPSADALTWTVRLKEGLEFHDGKTVTADDVIFSFQRILDPKDLKAGAEFLQGLKPSGLKKLDDRTVEFGLDQPNAVFDSGLSYYQNTIVPIGYDPQKPIGTGAFKFTSWRPGLDSDFARFDNYWGQVANVDSLKTIEFPDDTAKVNALLSGDVHMISNLPGSQIKVVEADPTFRVLNAKSGGWIPFTMRVDIPPFNDVRLRQAMRLIVDRPQMLQLALNDQGWVGNDMYAPFDPVYASDLPQRVQDTEQAKSLLKQAGQSDLRVELPTTSDYVGFPESAQVMREQAKLAGVTVNVKKLDSGTYWDGYLKFPFAQDWWYTRDYLLQTAAG
ncbi:MAG TPA: ABC transporter substrate-binding protein, partial [Thermoleophilia bacterium]|nr:ABC transporter substrate-binding protein [Thermoleophilia bacterium]